MLRLRPYNVNDVDKVLSWSRDERAFYKWSAGVLGEYPITKEQFSFVNNLMAFTAIDDDDLVGFFTMRRPTESYDALRFGFVVVDPEKRGKGYGKILVNHLIKQSEAERAFFITLEVRKSNENAIKLYEKCGFKLIGERKNFYSKPTEDALIYTYYLEE